MIEEVDKPIKLFRLVTGEDIIAKTIPGDALIFALSPLSIDIKHKEGKPSILLSHWSPTDIIDNDMCGINPNNILAVYQPSDDVKEYYLNLVSKMEQAANTAVELKKMKEELSPEDMSEILDAMEESIGHIRH